MATEAHWTSGVGFRHLIEDGLAILSDAPLNPRRRAYVLEDLSALLAEAKQGSDLVQSNALFATSEEQKAYESFSLLDRYLNQFTEVQWKEILPSAEAAFAELQKENPMISEGDRIAATSLLNEILAGLTRGPKSGIPEQPQEIQMGA